MVVCKWEVYHNFVFGQALVNNDYGYACIITLKIDMVLRYTSKKEWGVVPCNGSSIRPF